MTIIANTCSPATDNPNWAKKRSSGIKLKEHDIKKQLSLLNQQKITSVLTDEYYGIITIHINKMYIGTQDLNWRQRRCACSALLIFFANLAKNWRQSFKINLVLKRLNQFLKFYVCVFLLYRLNHCDVIILIEVTQSQEICDSFCRFRFSFIALPPALKPTPPLYLGSISPTFYKQLLCRQIPKAEKSCLT